MAFSASERFTIIDIDGELLASPGDELDIIEPVGFGEFINNIKADEEYFGFNAEFGEGESELSFDWNKATGAAYSGQEFVTWFVDNIGIDANISLRYYRTSGGIETLEYEWALILKSADEADAPISVRVKKEDFSDKLRTRFDTDIDVESAVDLDNNANSALSLIELPLHSRKILLDYNADFVKTTNPADVESSELFVLKGNSGTGSVINMGFPVTILDEIGISGLPYSDYQESADLWFIAPYDGVYSVDIIANAQDGIVGPEAGFNVTNLQVRLRINDSVTTFNKSTSVDPTFSTTSADFDLTQDLTLSAGDSVFLYWDHSTSEKFYQTPLVNSGGQIVRVDYAEISALTTAPPSTTTGHFIYEVLNTACNKAIGQTGSLIQSDLIEKITEQGAATDGYAALNFITTGKKIRGLTDNANLKVKPSQLFDFLRCRWAAGWQIVNDSGTKYIKLDKNWEFMEPVKILTLYNVENPIHRSFNQDIIYNESESGYSKFAKENEDGSIDGFNTKQDRLHPIEKEKKKFPLIAPVTTDGAEIERLRRLKIKEDESDQSDDEIIIIKCRNAKTGVGSISIEDYGGSVVVDDANNKLTINGIYLKGQADNAGSITIFLRNGLNIYLAQELTISAVSYNAAENSTTFTTPTAITAPDDTYPIAVFSFDTDVYFPETIQSFFSVSGVTDPGSEYNIDQAPSNFLIQWWHILGGAVTQKASTKIVKFINGKNTVSLSKRYRTTDGNLTTSQITEGQDFTLNSLNTYNPPIITPFAYDVICYLTYDDWQLIRRALLGENTDSPSKNWGYLEFTDNFGNLVQIWPRALKRTEKSGKVEIYGWQRNTATPPPPATFFILQENGDYLLQENGDRTLQEV